MAVWLDLAPDTTGWSLVDTGRMDEIVQGMAHPTTQYPSLVSFLGNDNRMAALRSLFPHNTIRRRGSAGLIRLHLCTTTSHTEYPILFGEASLQNLPAVGKWSVFPSMDGLRRYPFRSDHFESTTKIVHHLLTRLIFPWTHVVCLFVDSMRELRMARSLLEETQPSIQAGEHSAAPARTRVIVVLTSPTAVYEADFLAMVKSDLGAVDAATHTVSVLDLRERRQLSARAFFGPLQRLLRDK
ncbi:phospholipase, patatin family protein, partial [Aspergillus udagawae]